MELHQAIMNRVSTRSFTDQDVPDETVNKFLEMACRAPTAGNLQPWRFFVVRQQRVKGLLAEAAWGQNFVASAPVVIVFCSDLEVCAHGYGHRGETLYAIQDTAAAVENVLLSVVAEGLGACWVGAFSEERVSKALDLPPGIRPLALVPIGHPRGRSRPTRREPYQRYTENV